MERGSGPSNAVSAIVNTAKVNNLCPNTALHLDAVPLWDMKSIGGSHPKGTLLGDSLRALSTLPTLALTFNLPQQHLCTGRGPLLLPRQPATKIALDRYAVKVVTGDPTDTACPRGCETCSDTQPADWHLEIWPFPSRPIPIIPVTIKEWNVLCKLQKIWGRDTLHHLDALCSFEEAQQLWTITEQAITR
jgi:hypothetical protein